MSTSACITPFVQPGAPPLPVVVLLDATELFFQPSAPLLAFENLRPGSSVHAGPDRSSSTHNHYHPYHRETISAHSTSTSAHSNVPDPKTDAFCRADSSPLSSVASSPHSSPVPLANGPRCPLIVSRKITIEQLTGAGCKKLLSQVKWERTFLSNIKACFPKSRSLPHHILIQVVQKHAHALLFKHLDPALCFMDQDEGKMKDVRDQMVAKFPILANYENIWPLDIIIMGLLKYYSSHSKGASTKQVVNVLQEVVAPTSISSRTHCSGAAGART